MKKIFILPIFAILIAVLSFLPHDAHATTTTITDQSTCQGIGGSWSDTLPDTCTVTNLTLNSGDKITVPVLGDGNTASPVRFVINSGTLTINSGGELELQGSLELSSSTVNNAGTLDTGGNLGVIIVDIHSTINNSGKLVNGGFNINNGNIINNSGEIDNDANFVNSGTINEDCGGSLILNAPIQANQPVNACDVTTIFISANTVPPTTPGVQVTLSATVTDSTHQTNIQTGIVSWSSNGGSFNSNTCTLSNGACSVSFTASNTQGSNTVTASYGGTLTDRSSSASLTSQFSDELKDQRSCQMIGGSWNSGTNTCTVTNLSINSGGTLQIDGGVTLANIGTTTINSGGTISNLGTISNSGTMTNNDVITNTGGIVNNGFMTGTGQFNNKGGGTITNNNTFNPGAGSSITNAGTITNNPQGDGMDVFGPITNSGTINNSGTLQAVSTISNSGQIINSNSFFISKTFDNHGMVTNTNLIHLFTGSTLNNYDILTNNNSITNDGTINNYCGGIISGSISGNQPVNQVCDIIPPTLMITTPANNTETNSNTVTVSGTASDDTSVSSVTWKVDSGTVSTASGTTSWSFNTRTMPDGFHLVQINSTDSVGLVTEAHLGITIDTTPPVIAPISDQTVEATSSSGAAATFTATATDNIDGTDTVTCNPASGSTFALGSTTVTCNSQDAVGNVATPVTFTITIQDTTPPVLTLPSDITQEATGPSGNAVTYSTSANDLVDGSVIPICTPTSGSTFLVGTTPVTCTATDSHQNTASGTFHVIIQDTTPPMITVTDINAKATGTLTPVTFSPTATDIVDGTDPVTCNSASGSTFPLGTTTVNCSSTDKHGNTSPASFTVTVAETTAPSITLPADIAQEATGPAGNVVTFSPTATDIVDGTDPVTCNPASGSTFPLGSTAVTCTSSNNAGNTATESFHVTIQDTTPPTLTIQLPANNAIVNTATVPVSGISSDNVQVSSITWKVDSGTVSTASGTTSWSFTTNTLSTGLHTIYVNATDEAGNVVKSSMSVTYVEPTVTLPPPSGGTTPITFSSSTGGFTSLDSISPSSLSPHPPPGNYPLGFFSWSITGFAPATSVTVTITSPVPLHHQSHYFKLVDGSWVSIPVSVSGNTMTMTISDNGPFDGNPAVGVISDPGAVANPTDGRVTGDGTIGKNIDFTFEVRSDIDKADNTHGTLEFHDKSGGITLHSDRISFLSVDNAISQATFSGTGDLGKNHNYIFIASIADHDKTGNHDTFSITITGNTGKVVYTNSGTVKGHIEIHKFADKDDKSDSGSKHDNNHGKNSK